MELEAIKDFIVVLEKIGHRLHTFHNMFVHLGSLRLFMVI